MDEINKEILNTFGHQLRLRVCGFCLVDDQVLLVRHRGLGSQGEFWAPPGGGLQFGETVPRALEREFREETGLEVRVGRFLCVNEFLGPPLHAVELCFEVHPTGGHLRTGTDPEMRGEQTIGEVRLMSFEEINRKDRRTVHQLLRLCRDVQDVHLLQGYYVHNE